MRCCGRIWNESCKVFSFLGLLLAKISCLFFKKCAYFNKLHIHSYYCFSSFCKKFFEYVLLFIIYFDYSLFILIIHFIIYFKIYEVLNTYRKKTHNLINLITNCKSIILAINSIFYIFGTNRNLQMS